MKSLLVLLTLLVSSPAFAERPNNEPIYLDNVTVLNLAQGKSEMTIFISYAGPTFSGICAIEIVADGMGRHGSVSPLLGALKFTNPFSLRDQPVQDVSGRALRIHFFGDSYIGGVKIQTRDGSSLADVIKNTLGENRRVVVMPRSC